MNELFSACKILYIDHLAVSTFNFDQALRDYLSLEGARLIKGPNINHSQKVQYAFVQPRDGFLIELLAAEKESPLSGHLRQGGGPYHFCFAVADIDQSLTAAQEVGSKVVLPPVPDPAFDGRRIAFLSHRTHGLFELVEAFPVTDRKVLSASHIGSFPTEVVHSQDNIEIESQLQIVFSRVLPLIEGSALFSAAVDKSEGWDSLAQIQLIMEIEAQFGLEVPSDKIGVLTTYMDILEYLRRELL